MDKAGGYAGRARGRAQTSRSDGAPGSSRGRMHPVPTRETGGLGRGERPQSIQGSVQTQASQGRGGGEVRAQAPSAWGRQPAQAQVERPSTSLQRPPAPVALGRGTTHRDVAVAEASGEAAAKVESRGSVRGRRVLADLVPTRPANLPTKSGLTGQGISLQTNYFRILHTPQWSIHQYRIDFSPEVDMARLRRFYLAEHKELFGGYIFDGTVLFCSTYFVPEQNNGRMELVTKNNEGEVIQIKIRHVGIVDATDIQQLQILNLLLRRTMQCLDLQLVGRNYFDAAAKINLHQYRMELWPGYLTSVRQHERDILLCAEISHKVMRMDTVYDILRSCLNNGDFQHAFKQQVVGTTVLTDYNNKTYRIDDVDFEKSPRSKFSTANAEISFMEYYSKRYNIRINDPSQPLLLSRPTEKNMRGGTTDFIMLVPELCRATGLTDAMRNDFRLMRAMSEHTRLNPNRRIDRLKEYNQRLQKSKACMDVLASWRMELDKQLVEVPGRILKGEKIVFGNKQIYTCDRNADWTREFRNKSMYVQVDIKRWYVVTPKRNMREVQDFVKLCIRAASGMKMHISEPRYEEMPDDRSGSYSQAIDRATAHDPQLLMLVLVSNNEEKYSCIKKKCCVDRPVASQVVTLRTIAPRTEKAGGLMSIATKVVIQMNAKLMGAPWMVEVPLNGLMTVGFDVCHSAKDKNKSYGAFVATMNIRESTKYYSSVTQHMKGQELSNEIGMNMTCALKCYTSTHGTLPERIIFYRDGVGDGQLHQVYNTEVIHLKKKLDEIYASAGKPNTCRLAFIVVSKRINTRYFANGQNPEPGTVVDDIITLPERYDFFLVSQCVRQGTVSPTSYNVIHDSFGLSADRLQILTYKMTHMYYNWTGTLRVPAVCQYAHKLAFLVAESIHRAPHPGLENQLYFL